MSLSCFTKCCDFTSCCYSDFSCYQCCSACCVTKMDEQCDLAIRVFHRSIYVGNDKIMRAYSWTLLDRALKQTTDPDKTYELIMRFTEKAGAYGGTTLDDNLFYYGSIETYADLNNKMLPILKRLGLAGHLKSRTEYEKRTKTNLEFDIFLANKKEADKKQAEEAEKKRREEREREAALLASRPDLALIKKMHDEQMDAMQKQTEATEATRQAVEEAANKVSQAAHSIETATLFS